MAVHVTLSVNHEAREIYGADHATGKSIYVHEGHLFVSDSVSNQADAIPNTVAVYAPGKWYRAEVKAEQGVQ